MEEQFYLVWPFLLWLGLRWVRGRPGGLGLMAQGTLVLAAASAIEMGLLYSPGYDPTRVYDGTDTRAFALLIGAALAFAWPSRRISGQITEGARRILDAAGAVGLVIIGALILGTGQYSAFVYRGGMVLLSVATALVVGAAASPASRIGRVLGARPLRWIGVRSYGIYLWHYPIIVLTTPPSGQVTVLRGTLQLTASILAAALSWAYIEEPVRHGLLGRTWTRVRTSGWRPADFSLAHLNPADLNLAGRDLSPAGRRRWAAAASAIVVCGVAGAGLTGAVQPGSAAQLAAGSGPAPPSQTATRPAAASRVVRSLVARGYRGCWVLALGTNDTADVVVGSAVSRAARIARMMSVIGDQPVLWVNVKSLVASGPYAEPQMQRWDTALTQACGAKFAFGPFWVRSALKHSSLSVVA